MGSNGHREVPAPAMAIAANCERVKGYCDASSKGPYRTRETATMVSVIGKSKWTGTRSGYDVVICRNQLSPDPTMPSNDRVRQDLQALAASRTDLPRFVRAVVNYNLFLGAMQVRCAADRTSPQELLETVKAAGAALTRILNGDEDSGD